VVVVEENNTILLLMRPTTSPSLVVSLIQKNIMWIHKKIMFTKVMQKKMTHPILMFE
jgi:hypothetical protein